MKKFIYLIIANICMLFLLPVAIKMSGGQDSTLAYTVVFGNSIYFLVQSQIYSSKFDKPWLGMALNIPFILAYMFLYLGQFVINYLIFYVVMMFLGIRLGSVKKKIADMQKK